MTTPDEFRRLGCNDDPAKDVWDRVSRFEDGYELGHSDGLGSGILIGCAVATATLCLLWALVI